MLTGGGVGTLRGAGEGVEATPPLIALKAGRDAAGGAEGRLAVGRAGAFGAGSEGLSSGHASAGAEPPIVVLPYKEDADGAGRDAAGGGAGLGGGGTFRFSAPMSTFPTGV